LKDLCNKARSKKSEGVVDGDSGESTEKNDDLT